MKENYRKRLTRKSAVDEYLPLEHLNIHHLDANSEQSLTDLLDKLGRYEDLIEQDKVVELPVYVGETIYVLAECEHFENILDGNYEDATGYYCPYELNDKCPHTDYDNCKEAMQKTEVFEDIVSEIVISEDNELTIFARNTNVSGVLGEYIFLTKAEADQALEKEIGAWNKGGY